MITEEAFMDIVALHRQGHSIRFIAKKLGMHRNTVKKFIEGRRFPAYDRSKRGISILAPFVRIILDWLSQDNYRASWVFERLKPIGYGGSYETVKKFIRPIKEQQARIAYARFETMPGLQAQVDWADFRSPSPTAKPARFICSSWFWAIAGRFMPSSSTAAPWRTSWTHISGRLITWAGFPPSCFTTT